MSTEPEDGLTLDEIHKIARLDVEYETPVVPAALLVAAIAVGWLVLGAVALCVVLLAAAAAQLLTWVTR